MTTTTSTTTLIETFLRTHKAKAEAERAHEAARLAVLEAFKRNEPLGPLVVKESRHWLFTRQGHAMIAAARQQAIRDGHAERTVRLSVCVPSDAAAEDGEGDE
jgi:3,4-dihydroxy-2-butanone 4-phosphate synthase